MTLAPLTTDLRTWPGLDATFQAHGAAFAATPEGAMLVRTLRRELAVARGKPCRLGPPLMVKSQYATRLTRFAEAYHRLIEQIVRAYQSEPFLRQLLALPAELFGGRDLNTGSFDGRVHLCRLDLLLDERGGFNVIETNANCPGALLSMGIASRRWREHLTSYDVHVPAPLDFESRDWMARWFLDIAQRDTTEEIGEVPLLRQEGGNRLELPGLAAQLAANHVTGYEVDPRLLEFNSRGVAVDGRPIRHAYLKLGIPEFRQMSKELDDFVRVMLAGGLFVPNGVLGRFVGDNKLCLAVLSDPSCHHVLCAQDLDVVREHIPWSRAVAQCDAMTLQRIRANRSEFVLKRPLDTKGRGVVVGKEVETNDEWSYALDVAVRENWLVQEFLGSTHLEPRVGVNGGEHRHDISIGMTNGSVAGIIARSGYELRLNVARTGRLHPVFLGE